jgi:hypothetical protein
MSEGSIVRNKASQKVIFALETLKFEKGVGGGEGAL